MGLCEIKQCDHTFLFFTFCLECTRANSLYSYFFFLQTSVHCQILSFIHCLMPYTRMCNCCHCYHTEDVFFESANDEQQHQKFVLNIGFENASSNLHFTRKTSFPYIFEKSFIRINGWARSSRVIFNVFSKKGIS